MLDVVRVASLSGYVTVAERYGLDYHALLRQLGLTPSLLKHPEQFLSASAAFRLLEMSAKMSRCPTFGMQMAEERRLADLGMIGVLIALQPSLAALLDCFERYRSLILPIMAINVECDGDIAVIGIDLTLGSAEPHRQANDLLLAAAIMTVRSVVEDSWNPICTHFAYPEPRAEDVPIYRRIFKSELEFNAGFFGMTTTRRALLDEHDHRTTLAPLAEQLVIRAMRPQEPNLAQTVQSTLIYLLASSHATLEASAAALSMHPRTLQRRLDEEGYTFRELVNQARVQLAARLLANPSVKIAEIAEALGYSSTGAFSRWYVKEFGEPPTRQREYRLQ